MTPEINNQKNKKLIQKVSLSVLKTAIFQMKNSKSSGIDELPIEFINPNILMFNPLTPGVH